MKQLPQHSNGPEFQPLNPHNAMHQRDPWLYTSHPSTPAKHWPKLSRKKGSSQTATGLPEDPLSLWNNRLNLSLASLKEHFPYTWNFIILPHEKAAVGSLSDSYYHNPSPSAHIGGVDFNPDPPFDANPLCYYGPGNYGPTNRSASPTSLHRKNFLLEDANSQYRSYLKDTPRPPNQRWVRRNPFNFHQKREIAKERPETNGEEMGATGGLTE